ncbi:helix-turn-helix domain-containing protein [Colwellia sp. 12G3]|uniref:helix-turn-helix domain-containing protein n=1 Tax=Colwellia sp. 12G3 TaxID=2058299 RepID=UPI000C34744E|nr:helix-turn-helix domain-containing protein [Colwellia sp. 12G3]PKI16014.1 transcriptional regulator [Colwellia sp. 12G3]
MSKQPKSTSTQHANATTTPEMRAFIHESDLPTAVLARLLKISESTVRKWRKRDSLIDASHVPKQLNTTLSEAQEYVVVELRTRLLLSLDELLAVCKQFINANVSRAGLQRCLKRHGVSRLTDMQGDMEGNGESYDADATAAETVRVVLEDTQAHQQLTSDISPKAMREVLNRANSLNEDEVVQVKVTQIPDFADKSKKQQNKCRLLIANDPTSSWVYVDIYDGNESEAASRYMSYVLTKAPFHIRRILAGNYNEFLSRFRLLNDSPDEPTTAFSSKNFHGSDTYPSDT